MDPNKRLLFKQRIQQFKEYKQNNPDSGYWDWKNSLPSFEDGGIKEKSNTSVETLYYDTRTDHSMPLIQSADLDVHTTPDGEYNPFYNSYTDTYGTIPLKGVEIVASLTELARRKIEARRGAGYVDEGRRKAAPYIGAIVAGAALPAAASTGVLSGAIDLANIFTDPLNPLNYVDKFGKIAKYVDSGFIGEARRLVPRQNTLTRYVGTGDSGYRDALTSGVIRGNMRPSFFNAHELKKMNNKLKDILSESDIRDLNSNNINKDNFDRINSALKLLSSKQSVSKINLGKNYSLGNTYEDYEKLVKSKQSLFNNTVNHWSFNRSPEINDWITNWDGHNLATFARETEVLDNHMLFPGDYAVQIKNADEWERTAQHLGHLPLHKVTYKPVEYNNPDLTWYKRRDGIFTNNKYMIEVPRNKVEADRVKYTK